MKVIDESSFMGSDIGEETKAIGRTPPRCLKVFDTLFYTPMVWSDKLEITVYLLSSLVTVIYFLVKKDDLLADQSLVTAYLVANTSICVFIGVFLHLRFSKSVGVLIGLLIWLPFSIFFMSMTSDENTEKASLVPSVLISIWIPYLILLRHARAKFRKLFGFVTASMLSMTASVTLLVFINYQVYSYFYIHAEKEALYRNVLIAMGVMYNAAILVQWIEVHQTIFKRFPSQSLLLIKALYQENPYDLETIAECADLAGTKKEESSVWFKLQENSHCLLSILLVLTLIVCEIFLVRKLIDMSIHQQGFYTVLLYLIGVPTFLIFGLKFTASGLRMEDKVIVIGFFGLVSMFFSIQIGYNLPSGTDVKGDTSNFDKLTIVLYYIIPLCFIFWIGMSVVYQNNKRCYQLFSFICCASFFVPVGYLYTIYYEEDNAMLLFYIGIALAGLGLVFLVVFWLTESILKLSAYMVLYSKKTKESMWFDLFQFIYSFLSLVGFGLLFFHYLQQEEQNLNKGILLGAICILGFAYFCTVVVQRATFYFKKIGQNNPSLYQIVYEKDSLPRITPREEKEQKISATTLQVLAFIGIVGPIVAYVLSILVSTTKFMNAFGISLMAGCFGLVLITSMLFKLKKFLRNYGNAYVSYFCGCCWIFLLVPVLIIAPIILSYTDLDSEDEDSNSKDTLASLTLWGVALMFLLILGGVSAFSIFFNNLMNKMDVEKKERACISQMDDYFKSIGVQTSEENIRIMFSQFVRFGEESASELLNSGRIMDMVKVVQDDKQVPFMMNARQLKKLNSRKQAEEKKNKRRIGRARTTDQIDSRPSNDPAILIKDPHESPNEETRNPFDPQQDAISFEDVNALYEDDLEETEQVPKDSGLKCWDFFTQICGSKKEDESDSDESEGDSFEREFEVFELKANEIKEIQKSPQFDIMLSIPEAKDMWIHKVFDMFASAKSRFGQPRMTSQDFTDFAKASGLKLILTDPQIDNIYNKLNRYSEVPKLSILEFSEEMLDLVAEECDGLCNGKELFNEYMYPYLVTIKPSLGKFLLSKFKGGRRIEAIDLALSANATGSMNQGEEESSCNFESVYKCTIGFYDWLWKALLNAFAFSFRMCTVTEEEEEEDSEEKEGDVLENELTWPTVVSKTGEKIKTTIEAVGSSKNMPEKFRFNSTNFMAIMENAIEIYAFTAIALHENAGWDSAGVGTVSQGIGYVTADESSFFSIFAASFVSTIVFLFIAPAVNKKLKAGTLGIQSDGTVSKPWHCNFWLDKGASFLAKAVYFSIIETSLSGLSCKFDTENWVMMSNEEILCFEGVHWFYLTGGALGILLYYPFATLMYPNIQFQRKSLDLKYDSSYLIIESQAKLILAGLAVFFDSNETNFFLIQLMVTGIACLGLSVYTFKSSPCLIEPYNLVKGASFLIPFWACTCTSLKIIMDSNTEVTLYMMIGGFGMLMFGIVIMYFFIIQSNRKIDEEEDNQE